MSRWVALVGALAVVGIWVPEASALAAPVVALHPVHRAFTSSNPTLTGSAGVDPEDQARVYIGLYAGTVASGPPVRFVSGPRAADGSFAIHVVPGLPDGFYTAVAVQGSDAGNGLSAPLVIEVKVHPPALSFDRPGDGVTIGLGAIVFSGGVGTAVGDLPFVRLVLYSGSPATGSQAATRVIETDGSRWSYSWPHDLRPGSYTAIAQQAHNAGHILTVERSFRVASPSRVIGGVLSLDREGRVSTAITCLAEAGSCVGDVLALTAKPLQPVRGGPTGLIRLLFAHVAIAAGHTVTVSGRLPSAVTSALRRETPMRATVRAILRPTSGPPLMVFVDRLLRAG